MTVESAIYLAHGLRPGGVAGTGSTLLKAYHDLVYAINLVLYDFAEIAADFNVFKKSVYDFFGDVDEWAMKMFEEARKEVASGRITSSLPKVRDPKLCVKLEQLQQPEPADNPVIHSTCELAA